MKKCPYCAEEVQEEAIKCKHCGEFFNQKPKEPWYCKTSMIVLAVLTVGPLALPLIWVNPRYSLFVKIIISIVVIFASLLLYYFFQQSMAHLKQYMESLGIKGYF